MSRWSRTLAIPLLVLLTGRGAAQDGVPPRDDALWALVEQWLEPATSEARQEAAAAIAERLAPDTRKATVQQLFLFSKAAGDTPSAMAFGGLRRELPIADEDVLEALVALLEVDDEPLRRALAGTLSAFEDPSVDRGPSLAVYRPLLEARRARGEPDAPGLVRHLFRVDAHRAFLLFLALEPRTEEAFDELRALLLAEHEVEDARWRLTFRFATPETLEATALDALRSLAASRRPFARRYAASVLLQEPGLRPALPGVALRQDPDPLVRELAAAREALETR